ncbi:hypothetical protein ACIXQX_12495 [Bacteroides fragilis]
MSNQSIKYGILLTKEQLDFLKDDRQGFHRMTAFGTFVSMASTKPSVYLKTGFSASLSIGQFAISTVELSALWKCDRKTAAKVVELFNQVGILSTERNNRTSIHTILCIAFWYVDGIKEAIKNPFYNRQSVTSATQEESVSNVPSDTACSSEGNLSNGIGQQKDSSVNPATTDILQPHVPASYNTSSPFVNSHVIGDGLSDPSPIPQDFKQREKEGDDHLSMRLDSRQKMTAIKEKGHHPLSCCRLLSMMTRATSCSHRPMKDDARITRRDMARISPQVTHDVISTFPLFRLLTFPTGKLSRSRYLY